MTSPTEGKPPFWKRIKLGGWFGGLLSAAVQIWLIGAVLVLIVGFLAWVFNGGGTDGLVSVLRSAALWPTHFVR